MVLTRCRVLANRSNLSPWPAWFDRHNNTWDRLDRCNIPALRKLHTDTWRILLSENGLKKSQKKCKNIQGGYFSCPIFGPFRHAGSSKSILVMSVSYLKHCPSSGDSRTPSRSGPRVGRTPATVASISCPWPGRWPIS